MGRSQESSSKKEQQNKKEKNRKEKEKKRLARKENEKGKSLNDMTAYVDKYGNITSTPPDPDQKDETKLEDIRISVSKQDPSLKPDPIRKGIVGFFNESKGFGFIKDSETKESVFFHVNNVLEEIKEGNIVSFEVEMGKKGPTAVKVKLHK